MATEAELQTISGIGQKSEPKISLLIEGGKIGKFQSVDELKNVSGLAKRR